jgi:hypothetical protein
MIKSNEPGNPDDLQSLWDDLLSREPARIRAAFANLTGEEQQAVQIHLQHMLRQPGWHAEQRKSALAALEALGAIE